MLLFGLCIGWDVFQFKKAQQNWESGAELDSLPPEVRAFLARLTDEERREIGDFFGRLTDEELGNVTLLDLELFVHMQKQAKEEGKSLIPR